MKTGLVLFTSSAAFGTVISLIYWFASRDMTGTVLLGIMAFALVFAAGYMVFAEREARLMGDRKDATNEEAKGEAVGVYTTVSRWPVVCALGFLLLVLGLVGWTELAYAGIGVLLWGFWQMIKEGR